MGDHSEKQKVREDRLRAAAISAMKQSLRVHLPEIRVEKSLKNALNSVEKPYRIVAADETSGETAFPATDETRFVLVVGPEGGFSEKERELMKNQKAAIYSLGKKRLRAETAAIIMVDRFRSGLNR
jgi:16S rRNA (uracil1498-N3)-methyltransferase